MRTVAVFFGGRSSEREISVITGLYAANLLRGAGGRVVAVYLPPEGGMLACDRAVGVEAFRGGDPEGFVPVVFGEGGLRFEKRPKKFYAPLDCALNCCHGGAGEGGVLSALLEWYGIRSASPGMAPSALFLDKSVSKLALRGLGVPVVPSVSVREEEFRADEEAALRRIGEALGDPVIVKPARLGSSVGISVARGKEELRRALAFAFRLDGVALVETYLENKRDLNIAAVRLGGELLLSPVEEVFSGEPILTFGEKYEGAGGRASALPAAIPEETASRLGEILTAVYEAFGLRGIVRADFLLAGEELYFNELNTVPGSLATYLFGRTLTEARSLLVRLIEEGSAPLAEKEVVTSGILGRMRTGGKAPKRP